jgi:hypothetical protein
MSHYFGFGNLQIDNLQGLKAKTTGLEQSGKFKEKLILKQK